MHFLCLLYSDVTTSELQGEVRWILGHHVAQIEYVNLETRKALHQLRPVVLVGYLLGHTQPGALIHFISY